VFDGRRGSIVNFFLSGLKNNQLLNATPFCNRLLVRTNVVKGLKMSAFGVPYGFFGLIEWLRQLLSQVFSSQYLTRYLVPCENAKGGDRSV